jgi:hypothetical protein
LTFPTFCQIGIVTQSGDSLIALPKKTVIFMVKDIVRGDGYKEQVNILNGKIDKLNQQVQAHDSVTTTLQAKCRSYKATIDEYVTIDEVNQRTIQSLNKTSGKLRKQRNALGYFAAALLVGLIVR